ncbi:MazG-like pyrophosphatase [Aeromonas phage GomatiRiver_11]|nr:hypothetical protein OBDJBBDK_00073 [Aeromonas phage AhFM11]WKW84246.1 MazG-like pyrophosphatase [Aeromonas phage GomatiRiver_11]
MIRLKCIDRDAMIDFILEKCRVNNFPIKLRGIIESINIIERQTYQKIDGQYCALTPTDFKIAKDVNQFMVEVVPSAKIDLTSSFTASITVPDRSMGFVLGKLIEEVGEFAKSLNQPERCDERPVGEAADVINCVVDLLYLQYKADHPELPETQIVDMIKNELNEQLDVKSAKWVKKACIK